MSTGDGMNRGQNQTIAILNKLIETCRNGQEGFLAAADRIPDGDLKDLFNSYSRQRAQFLRELREEVRRRGGELEATGKPAGAPQRGWIDTKAAAVGVGEEAVITECQRGEDAAVKSYQEAIAAQLPGELL
ncbi:MAG: ferritin-like domain-containing protein, partial [Pyrinomonadaceae bacterium]